MSPVLPQIDLTTSPWPDTVALAPAPTTVDSTQRLLHRQRLSAVLRGLVESFGISGAELCLLDDATAELRTAADFGDQQSRGPRLLESARADVTALAGNAVVLEDPEMVADWPVPQRCQAAVCVPVASDTTIHGTLWLYARQARVFNDNELQLIEIAAGRLAVEVERRRLLDAQHSSTPAAPSRLPQPTPPTELGELEVGGWSTAGTPAAHDWLQLADGRLLMLAAAVVDMPGGNREDAMLAAQAARIAARCYAEADADRLLDAGALLTRVSSSIWQATPGGEGLSIALAIVDPEECEGTYALAGGAAAFSVRASRTTVEATEAPPAGWDRDERYAAHRFELSLRERLVFAIVDPRRATPLRLDKLANNYRGLSSETHRRMTAEAAAATLESNEQMPQAVVAVRWK